MGSNPEDIAPPGEFLEILVFDSGGVWCGIDGELVSRMARFNEAGQEELTLGWLQHLLSFGGREVTFRNPMVVRFKESGATLGLVIDQPRELLRVALEEISPLPSCFTLVDDLGVFWGALVWAGKVVLLLDPHKLLAMAVKPATNRLSAETGEQFLAPEPE